MKIAERYGARIDDEGRLFVPGEHTAGEQRLLINASEDGREASIAGWGSGPRGSTPRTNSMRCKPSLHNPMRFSVVASDLVEWPPRQYELFEREGAEIQGVLDTVRRRFGARAVTLGESTDRSGRYTGLKISFEHIPDLEHFAWLGIAVPERKSRSSQQNLDRSDIWRSTSWLPGLETPREDDWGGNEPRWMGIPPRPHIGRVLQRQQMRENDGASRATADETFRAIMMELDDLFPGKVESLNEGR